MARTVDELYEFARNPETVLGGPRIFQAWGRLPGDPEGNGLA
jgi:hypothetical protein